MRLRAKVAGLLFSYFWLAACSKVSNIPLAVAPTPIATSSLTDTAITPANVSDLRELTRLTAEQAGPVAAIKFTPDLAKLLVAYSEEEALRAWQLTDGSELHKFDVQLVELGGVSFDAKGTMLATSAGANWEAHKAEDRYLGWQIWDTQTGKKIDEGGKIYDSPVTRHIMPSIQITPNGQWVLMIHDSAANSLLRLKGLVTEGLATPQTGDADVNFGRKPEEDDFDVIAFDAQGEYFAAADEAGKVAIYSFVPPAYPRVPRAILEKGNINSLGPRPLALAFDSTRHWLARIRGTELVVWDLQSANYPRQLETSAGNTSGITASLSFNPTGDLLGVGSATGWQIWNLESGELEASGSDSEVFAVAFSPDGRLFAWGDSSGVVHLWGVE